MQNPSKLQNSFSGIIFVIISCPRLSFIFGGPTLAIIAGNFTASTLCGGYLMQCNYWGCSSLEPMSNLVKVTVFLSVLCGN